MKFEIYQGKDEETEERFAGYGLGERIVLKLTEAYWKQNRKIYFDNYFTTVELLEKLKAEGTACGTIRSNRRGLPKNMKTDKQLEGGRWIIEYRVQE